MFKLLSISCETLTHLQPHSSRHYFCQTLCICIIYIKYICLWEKGRDRKVYNYGLIFFQAQHFKHILYVLKTWIVIFHVTKITHNLYLFQVLSFLRIISADRVYTCQVYTLTLRFWHQFIFSGWSLENWIKEKLPLILIRKWEILQFGFF